MSERPSYVAGAPPVSLTGDVSAYLKVDLVDTKLKKEWIYHASAAFPVGVYDVAHEKFFIGTALLKGDLRRLFGGDVDENQMVTLELESMVVGQGTRGIGGYTAGKLLEERLTVVETPAKQKRGGIIGRLFG
jgi:hypothetical protein